MKLTAKRSDSVGRTVSVPSLRAEFHEAGGEITSVHLLARIRFAHVPEFAQLKTRDNKVLWEWKGELVSEEEFEIPRTRGGIEDLIFTARWSETVGHTAVEVRVEPDGMSSASQTIWAEREVNKTLSFYPEHLR